MPNASRQDGREVVNVEGFASMMYGTDEPTKSQRNHVCKLCRQGKLNATRAGRRWLIRVDWPGAVE